MCIFFFFKNGMIYKFNLRCEEHALKFELIGMVRWINLVANYGAK